MVIIRPMLIVIMITAVERIDQSQAESLGWNPAAATSWLCDLGHTPLPFSFFICKMG